MEERIYLVDGSRFTLREFLLANLSEPGQLDLDDLLILLSMRAQDSVVIDSIEITRLA
jgi:hypothetical protein